MFTVCTMLLGIYNDLKKNLAYGRLDCISGLRINFVIYFIQHFLFFYVFIFYFFPQLSKTLFDKEFTTHSIHRSASRWAARCGADGSTIKRAERWCVEGCYITACSPEHCVKYYDYIDEKSFPACNHKLVGLHWGVALTWVFTVLVQFSD